MSLHISRVHTHALARQTTVLSGHFCNVCYAGITGESYRCAPCNYDLCSTCLGKTKATMPTRVHVHPLVYTTVGLSSHYCDLCAGATTRDAWRCATCNFDCCTSCFETVQLPKPTPTPVVPTETKATPVVAKHAHPLTAQTGAAAHYCDNCKATVAGIAVHRCDACNYELCGACHRASEAITTRFHSHPLTFVTTGLTNHYCDVCRVPTTTASWRCAVDNFDLCVACFERSRAPKPVIPSRPVPVEAKVHGHPLTRTTSGLANKFCDGCKATPLSVSYRCASCNFDLCTSCYDSINKRVVSLHPHALAYTTVGVATHWCDGCRGTIGANNGSYRCADCNFDLCVTCIERVKVPKPVAPAPAVVDDKEPIMTKAHGHALVRTTSGLAGHYCDGCRQTGLTVAYRCQQSSCNFDLCVTCTNRNRSSQVTRMHAHPLIFTRGLKNNHCDDCRKTITASWRCQACDFDLCGVCFVRAKMVKPRPAAPVVPSPAIPTPAIEIKADAGVAVKTHAHVVTRNTGSLIGKYCDQCSASPLSEAFSCTACNYDLCTNCYNTQRVEQTTRLHAHAMTWTSGLQAHYCDACRRSAESAYRCSGCNYDICLTCFDGARVVVSSPATPTPSAPVAVASPAVAVPVATPVVAAVAPTTFWPCSACTYINVASATECYICATTKP